MKRASVGIAAVVVLLSVPIPVESCMCGGVANETPEQIRQRVLRSFNGSDAVFTSEVVTTDTLGATLKVERVWKGKIAGEVRMRHATSEPGIIRISTCDYRFVEGKKYLVFADAVSVGQMKADKCGPTGQIESAHETIRLLDDFIRDRR